MLKSFTAFRVQEGWQPPSFAELSNALARAVFRPCGPTERRTSGWVPPRGIDHGPLLETVGGQWLMSLMSETRPLPASAVRAELDLRLELQHTEAIKRAVEANLGIGCLSAIALREAIARGSLVALSAPQRDWSRRFYFILHKQKYRSAGVQSWLALCRRHTA